MSRSPALPPLIVATNNADKLREFRWLLALDDWPMGSATSDCVVEETLDDYRENAARKATSWARANGQWALADDTGLEVAALHGAPGPRSARFAGPTASAAENRRRLLDELAGVPIERRGARFVCHLAVADPQGVIRWTSVGQCVGTILDAPRGGGGFGYDSLLWLSEYHATLAQLPDAARWLIGHRGRAWLNGAARLAALGCS